MAKAKKPLPSLEWLTPRVKLTRALTLFCFFSLIALLLIWNLGFAELGNTPLWLVLTIQLVPLLLVAPGMLLGHARAYAWACFIINLYFIQGILAAISVDPNRALFGVLESVITFLLFCCALMYTRWRFQYDRRQRSET